VPDVIVKGQCRGGSEPISSELFPPALPTARARRGGSASHRRRRSARRVPPIYYPYFLTQLPPPYYNYTFAYFDSLRTTKILGYRSTVRRSTVHADPQSMQRHRNATAHHRPATARALRAGVSLRSPPPHSHGTGRSTRARTPPGQCATSLARATPRRGSNFQCATRNRTKIMQRHRSSPGQRAHARSARVFP
jgi:hypothetical protein